ncbi:hypothetical protein DRQ33_04620, partial [bacterium]
MKKCFIPIFILFVTIFAKIPIYYNSLADVMFAVFDNHFQRAYSILDSLSVEYPDDPSIDVFRIIARASELHDMEDESGFENLMTEIDSVEKICLNYWGKEPESHWVSFVMANLYGQKAILSFIGENRNILTAWKAFSRAAELWEYASQDSILA